MRLRLAASLTLSLSLLASIVAGCVGDDLAASGDDELAAEQSDLDISLDPGLQLITPCTSVTPDKILYIGTGYSTPPSALPVTVDSTSAAYYYTGCGRFVTDVYVGASPVGLALEGDPSAHDLPSSSAIGGTMPANALDCGQYRQYQTFWHKKGAGAFTQMGYANQKGYWNGYYCQLQTYSGTMPALLNQGATPGAGWDVYRIAVATRLRTSGQAAELTMRLYQAPPS